jgi:murein DD-endopeptidase MepM/ murein hydrolase activator NlpD
MTFAARLRARLHRAASHVSRHDIPWASAVATMAVSAALTGMLVDATAQVRADGGLSAKIATALPTAQLMSGPRPVTLRWEGADVDGDGAEDFANPTGGQMRREDHYGYGHFGAPRDGGSRDHKGVDYIATAGQPVKAPISGYVTRIGFAYSSSPELKYIEIRNPALRYEARVFYVDPDVREGQSVHLGDVIGTMHTLQEKYGEAMTNHVHLELSGPDGVKFDATRVLTAHVEVLPSRG